jgi:hypothetical protein
MTNHLMCACLRVLYARDTQKYMVIVILDLSESFIYEVVWLLMAFILGLDLILILISF